MQKFRALCQRYAGWILLTLMLLLCQRWWMARGKPQRLQELPEGYEFTRLHDGLLYVKKNDSRSLQQSMTRIRRPGSSRMIPVMTNIKTPDASTLFTMPAEGGPLRPVPPDSLETASPDTLFPAGADTYCVEYRKTTPGLVGIPPGYGAVNSIGYGVPGGPPAPPPPLKPPFHTVIQREEADGVEAILRRVAGSGYTTTVTGETLTCPMGYAAKRLLATPAAMSAFFKTKIAFAGNSVFWIKHFPDQTAYWESANRQIVGKFVLTYRSAIMTMPLQGGTPRPLLDNVPSDMQLLASEDGVLCRINKGYRSAEWLRLRSDGAAKRILSDYGGYQEPVECDHHFYWAQSSTQTIYRPEATNIIEANADGSHVHTLYTVNDSSDVRVYQWQGRVYFYTMTAPTPQQFAYKMTLYRIHPALGAKPLCALPDNTMQIMFDGEYAYGLAREEKTGVLDTFRSESGGYPCLALYRYRLPDK